MYAIKIKRSSLGFKLILLKRFLWIWWPECVTYIHRNYRHMAAEQVVAWIEDFEIPKERVWGVEILR